MSKARHLLLPLGAAAAVLIAVACQEPASPTSGITAGIKPPPPPPPKGGGDCANYRLTGGGRTDQRSEHPHSGFEKSTPTSHDFATFGFQARPDGCPEGGSGQQEWNEHGDAVQNAFRAPFAFHGRVTFFTTPDPADPTTPESECGRYGGSGRLNFHSGQKVDGVPFVVEHACDVAEPGVGKDHISIRIGPVNGITYRRHGLLSGGNIQWHRLTGNN